MIVHRSKGVALQRIKLFVFVGALLTALALVGFAGAARQATVKFKAALNVGQEVPHPKGTKVGASGRFTATLTGTKLTWRLTFAHLSGPATQAHVHKGVKGKSGPVLIPLCAPCKSPVSGTATVTAAEIAAMKAGKMYVNVHTAKNPAGEIRGQVTRAL
jgi:hypothetical protein